jgi:protein-S-isoprenylcysteine O-methyltransferase Ste14
MRTNALSSAAVVVALVFLVMRFQHVPWTPMRLTGAGVLAVSVVLIGLARYQLGSAFSVSAKASRLVTTGVYSRLRNPIYVGSPLFIIGLALFTMNLWILALLIVIVPLQIMRARTEARTLHAAFGEVYERYSAQTWF